MLIEIPKLDIIVEHLKKNKELEVQLDEQENYLLMEAKLALKEKVIKKKDLKPFIQGIATGFIRASILAKKDTK